MIVNDLKKLKNNNYNVTIDNKSYEFSEDVILKYRLVNGKEVTSAILNEAIKANDLSKYYNRALNYALKYLKSEKEIYYYLLDLELTNTDISYIINRLKEVKAIDDSLTIKIQTEGLVRALNGKLLIKEKLKAHKYDNFLIEEAISNIDDELYFECLDKLYKKAIVKYAKEKDDFIRKNKIKRYLYQRGYFESDIKAILD